MKNNHPVCLNLLQGKDCSLASNRFIFLSTFTSSYPEFCNPLDCPVVTIYWPMSVLISIYYKVCLDIHCIKDIPL